MILTVDIGNMTTLLGGFDGEKLRFTSRCSSDRARTEDEFLLLFRDLLGMYGVAIDEIEGSILCSVVPILRTVVSRALERLTGNRVLVVGPGLKNGLNIRIDTPGELGGDMVVNAVAALARYKKPIVIFDMDTATTMSVIGNDGAYLGGALVPGVKVSVDAMSASAAQLPYITLTPPEKLICSSTVSCMQSGAVYGGAAMVDGLSSGVEEELGEKPTIILTGSYASLIAPYCKKTICLDENLQLNGLRLLYEKNISKRRKGHKA